MTILKKPERTADYKPLLAWFCVFVLAWTTLLLYAGGFTTTIRAGMAFLDWPLSDGSINPEGWLTETDKMAEHSHRILATGTGILCIIQAIWLYLRESRIWLRRLGWAALLLVIFQGFLGGARVLFDQLNSGEPGNLLAQTFAVLHGITAYFTFCVLIAVALATSHKWVQQYGGLTEPVPKSIRLWGLISCGVLFLQLLLGAMMRQANAGLAITTFPFASAGSLLPDAWDFRIAIHFAHRAVAALVTISIAMFLGRIWGFPTTRRALAVPSIALIVLLTAQIYLGALVIWSVRSSYIATFHMLTGAFVLAATWVLTLLSYRFYFGDKNSLIASRQDQTAPSAKRLFASAKIRT
jgi:cytochrome c oxidase assembly protein subunit 15